MYSQLAEIPVPTAALFLTPHGASQSAVQVTYSVRYHEKNTKRTMIKSIVLPTESIPVMSSPLQDTDTIAQVVSPSGRERAIWRKATFGSDTTPTRLVELWNDGVLEHSWNVTDYHGDFYADEYLGSFCFAPSEKALIYVAEGKAPETQDPFQKFRFNPDFGEGLAGKRKPTIFILRCEENSKPLTVHPKNLEGVRLGQAVFSPTSDEIIYATGYEFTVDGRILGIKGCFNRPSGIWQLRLTSNEDSLTAECLKITASHLSCRSPRTLIHRGRSLLYWLSCLTSGAHLATSMLYSLDITSENGPGDISLVQEPLVDTIEVPDSNGFPGLYPDYNLPLSSFVTLPDTPSVILSSMCGSRKNLYQVCEDAGPVLDITPKDENGFYSWSVLAGDGHSRIICTRSSPSVPYEIMLGTFDKKGQLFSWQSIDKPALPKSVETALSGIRTSIIPVPRHGLVETIVIQKERKESGNAKTPCITSPHGGPHGSASTVFSPLNAALVLEGYTLSLPNYTGSPGYGEQFLRDLIGKCGDLDIEDTMASARHLIELGIAEEGPGKQFITGGSHGGYITAHLIGRYPEFFSAAVLRNPVISAGEISSTDIPDWYFSEFGLSYPIASLPPFANTDVGDVRDAPLPPLVNVDTFAKLQAASPISHIDAIKAPVLLLIGAADRRVAPSHGIEFYHALKARYSLGNRVIGRKVEMLMFEGESHPLDGVEASKASFEATLQWFASARKEINTPSSI